MPTELILHGHFYQPPRENPWTGVIDDQPSAQPYRNWNERIYYECYRPNAFARVLDGTGRIEKIVNNYSWMSFNYGPTLLSWIEQHHPYTYDKIIEADRESAKRLKGHGNALAQAYNHAILPLCNERDRRTQIRWGISDFKFRFGREPESLWLAETAVNDEVMECLIEEGLKFLILSPHQAQKVRPIGVKDWHDVSDGTVDPGRVYRWNHRDGSGRSLAVFFYDPNLAKTIAFEGALRTSEHFLGLIRRSMGVEGRLVHTATDGESYGHHYKFGDRSLAYALESLAPRDGFAPSNYGAYLSSHPPEWEAELKPGPNGEGTAWSCAHGVGRWIRDCGCHTGGLMGWNQSWRGPLREALDFLRDGAAEYFESERGKLFVDPWVTRDAYIELVLDRKVSRTDFLNKHAGRILTPEEQIRALTQLEVQRHTQLMYTSCAWFFNDLSGIETLQVLQYAGRVFDLLSELGAPPLLEPFLSILGKAKSNLPEQGTGADLYRRHIETARVTPAQVAAHVAMAQLSEESYPATGVAGGYSYECRSGRREHHGRLNFLTSRMRLTHLNTQRVHLLSVAALHLGGVDFNVNVMRDEGEASFHSASSRLWEQFYAQTLSKFLGLMAESFGSDEYGVEHLLPEGRHRVFESVFGSLVDRFVGEYATLYDENRRNLEMLQAAGFSMPREITVSAEFTLSRRLHEIIRGQEGSQSPAQYSEALAVAQQASRQGLKLDLVEANRHFTEIINRAVLRAVNETSDANLQSAVGLLNLARQMGLEPNLNRPQELVYDAMETSYDFDRLIPLADLLGLDSSQLAQRNKRRVVEELGRKNERLPGDQQESA